jgi:hypothetical protein
MLNQRRKLSFFKNLHVLIISPITVEVVFERNYDLKDRIIELLEEKRIIKATQVLRFYGVQEMLRWKRLVYN